MFNIDSLTPVLAQALPDAAPEDLRALVGAIIAAQQGAALSPAPALTPLLQQLAGRNLTVGQTTLSFDGAQLGDVRIGDVVSGILIKVISIQLVLAPLTQAPLADPQRQAMLKRIQTIWGLLKPVSEHDPLIPQDLVEQPDAIASSLREQVQDLRQAPRSFPHELSIGALFEQLGYTLLILGEPGAGKTRLLCELLRDRLARAERDPTQRIPVIFNLSSWSAHHVSLATWLSEELTAKYDVPRTISRAWVRNDMLLPLLDGLDEIAPKQRASCIEAINHYRDTYGFTPLAICVRTKEYYAQPLRLRLQGAVCIRPLQAEQIQAYLDTHGAALDGLRDLLAQDQALRTLAETPLMLTLMAAVYRESTPVQLGTAIDPEQRRRELFDRYIAVMFQRRSSSTRYARPDLLRWLVWMAQTMQVQQQELFLVEQIQAAWLPSRAARLQYLLLDRLGFALLVGCGFALLVGCGFALLGSPNLEIALWFGAVASLIAGFFSADNESLLGAKGQLGRIIWNALLGYLAVGGIVGLAVAVTDDPQGGVSAGLLVGFLGGIVGTLAGRPGLHPRRIRVIETLGWSWRRALRAVLVCSIGMGAINGLLYQLPGVLLGVVSGLGMSLIGGLTSGAVPVKVMVNQGIRRSLRSMVVGGLLGALFGGALGWITRSPESALISALLSSLIGALVFGGYSCCSHLALRLVLWGHRLAPLHYAAFLDEAAARILLQRVGGGYRFIHRLLQAHFAAEGLAAVINELSETRVDDTFTQTPKGMRR